MVSPRRCHRPVVRSVARHSSPSSDWKEQQVSDVALACHRSPADKNAKGSQDGKRKRKRGGRSSTEARPSLSHSLFLPRPLLPSLPPTLAPAVPGIHWLKDEGLSAVDVSLERKRQVLLVCPPTAEVGGGNRRIPPSGQKERDGSGRSGDRWGLLPCSLSPFSLSSLSYARQVIRRQDQVFNDDQDIAGRSPRRNSRAKGGGGQGRRSERDREAQMGGREMEGGR